MKIGLRIIAVLIGLRGVGNILKSYGTGSGIVILGRLLPPTSVLAPLLGVYMIVLAVCLWAVRPIAIPLGIAYAIFATLNVLLFPSATGLPPGITPWMYAVYAITGAGIPWVAVGLLVLTRQAAASRAR